MSKEQGTCLILHEHDGSDNDLQGIGRGRVDWINLAQDRNKLWAVVNTAMNIRIPQTAENLLNK